MSQEDDIESEKQHEEEDTESKRKRRISAHEFNTSRPLRSRPNYKEYFKNQKLYVEGNDFL
jgi:hypothetical protein